MFVRETSQQGGMSVTTALISDRAITTNDCDVTKGLYLGEQIICY